MADNKSLAANPRAEAAAALAQLIEHGVSLSASLTQLNPALEPRDRALARELVYGTARLLPRLRGLVDQLLKKPLRSKDGDIYALMLLGCYQLSYTRIPDHAAISETVKIAGQLRKHWAKALINGVLRQYQRRMELLEKNLDAAQQLAHPAWLLSELQAAWPEHWRGVVAANNQSAPMCLRVNSQRTTRDEYLQQLAAAGMSALAGELSADAVYLEKACDVSALPGFENGLVSVQDEAAQLSARLVLQDRPTRVLDACAAPGGKTCHLLELAPGLELDALELDTNRIDRIESNLERLGLRASLQAGDAIHPETWWDGHAYEAILVDAPCSATGVVRRNPDIKTLRRPRDARQLHRTQVAMLQALWPCLAPGGLLVYATCSVLPQENSQTIEAFLEQTPGAVHLPINSKWGLQQNFGRQLLPLTTGNDGFYYACLRKIDGAAAGE